MSQPDRVEGGVEYREIPEFGPSDFPLSGAASWASLMMHHLYLRVGGSGAGETAPPQQALPEPELTLVENEVPRDADAQEQAQTQSAASGAPAVSDQEMAAEGALVGPLRWDAIVEGIPSPADTPRATEDSEAPNNDELLPFVPVQEQEEDGEEEERPRPDLSDLRTFMPGLKADEVNEALEALRELPAFGDKEEAGWSRRGGRLVSEEHDEHYLLHFSKNVNVDVEEDRVLLYRLLRGLHKSPAIPIKRLPNGFLGVDFAAFNTWLEPLGVTCLLHDLGYDDDRCMMLQWIGGEGDKTPRVECMMPQVLHALQMYRKSHISPARPLLSAAACEKAGNGPRRKKKNGELFDDLDLSDDYLCCICLRIMVDAVKTGCDHSGCKKCMEKCCKSSKKCPLCRRPLRVGTLEPDQEMRDHIAGIYQKEFNAATAKAEEERKEREECVAMAKAEEEQVASHDEEVESDCAQATTAETAPPPSAKASQFAHPEDLEAYVESWHMVKSEPRAKRAAELYAASVASSAARLAQGPEEENEEEEEEEEEEEDVPRADRLKSDLRTPTLAKSIQNISNENLRRLLRRTGVVLETQATLDEARIALEKYLDRVIRQSFLGYSAQRERMLVVDDVLGAARRLNYAASAPGTTTVLGFGCSRLRFLWSDTVKAVLKQVHPHTEIDHVAMSVMNDIMTHTLAMLVESAAGFAEQSEPAEFRSLNIALPCSSDTDAEPGFKVPLQSVLWHGAAANTAPLQLLIPVAPDSRTGDYFDKFAGDPNVSEQATTQQPITHDCIKRAINACFDRELVRHAVSESVKYNSKFCNAKLAQGQEYLESSNFYEAIAPATGILFSPAIAALVARKFTKTPLSVDGAISLSAAVEYMSAEILELSGNSARNSKSSVINQCHVAEAVVSDEELDVTYRGCIFRRAGVTPLNCWRPKTDAFEKRWKEVYRVSRLAKMKSSFQGATSSLMQTQASVSLDETRFGIDPRTGKHWYLSKLPAASDVYDEEQQVFRNVSATLRLAIRRSRASSDDKHVRSAGVDIEILDAVVADCTKERAKLAAEALSDEERAKVKEDGFRIKISLEERAAGEGWAQEPIALALGRRRQDLFKERTSCDFCIDCPAFERAVRQMAKEAVFYNSESQIQPVEDKRPWQFTAEAVECLHTLAENYLVETFKRARIIASQHDERFLLLPKDISLARKLAGEWGWKKE